MAFKKGVQEANPGSPRTGDEGGSGGTDEDIGM